MAKYFHGVLSAGSFPGSIIPSIESNVQWMITTGFKGYPDVYPVAGGRFKLDLTKFGGEIIPFKINVNDMPGGARAAAQLYTAIDDFIVAINMLCRKYLSENMDTDEAWAELDEALAEIRQWYIDGAGGILRA